MVEAHIGISHLSSYLKSRGHKTRLAVVSSETRSASLEVVADIVAEFGPQIIGFTAVSSQYAFVAFLAEQLRQKWPDLHLIIGGAHASLSPSAISRIFDAICVGEGELPMAELAEQLAGGKQPSGIANLWIRKPDGTMERNASRAFMQDLDALPFIDREIWREWVVDKLMANHVVLPSRGCPYHCAYCSNHALRKIGTGKYVRFRSPGHVAREIREITQKYPDTESIYLQSETLVVDLEWLRDFSSRLKAINDSLPRPIRYTCNFRVSRPFLRDKVFVLLEQAGVKMLEIGLESGSERVRREVLRRHYSNEEFFQSVAMARQHGMDVNVYNMIGIPTETPADHWETVEVNRTICPNRADTCIFYPYPGTDLYETCQKMGLLTHHKETTAERFRATLDIPTFSKRQIQHAYEWFDFRIYKGHKSFSFRLRKLLRKKVSSHTWMLFLYLRYTMARNALLRVIFRKEAP